MSMEIKNIRIRLVERSVRSFRKLCTTSHTEILLKVACDIEELLAWTKSWSGREGGNGRCVMSFRHVYCSAVGIRHRSATDKTNKLKRREDCAGRENEIKDKKNSYGCKKNRNNYKEKCLRFVCVYKING